MALRDGQDVLIYEITPTPGGLRDTQDVLIMEGQMFSSSVGHLKTTQDVLIYELPANEVFVAQKGYSFGTLIGF